MNYWTDVTPIIGNNVVGVIEIPKGSNAKYEYNIEQGYFELNRCLITAMSYPANYGFIPKTLAPDNDPLDCIVFTDVPLQSGTVVEGDPIAVLKMFDDGEVDDKILIVPKFNKRYEDHLQIKQEYLDVYEDFFRNYKNLSKRKVEVIGWEGRDSATQIIEQCHQNYVDKVLRS